MVFISDDVITAEDFLQAYIGREFTLMDTYGECQKICSTWDMTMPKTYRLSEISKIPQNVHCLLVRFGKEKYSWEYEYKILTIQKKYLPRIVKALNKKYVINKQ